MTASTEQERTEFELWWQEHGQLCRAGGGDYEKTFAYRAWQAARRAQVVAVPQEALALLRWAEFLLATSAPMTSQQKEAWPSLQKAADEMRAYQASMLAAAPQPPEADMGIPISASALAQLPEIDIDTANHAGIRVRGYTQETVRQLLAAHGIEVAP